MTETGVTGASATLPDLRRLTQARVLLGRYGAGVPTRAAQAFLLDHARARQAVWSEFDRSAFRAAIGDCPLPVVDVESLATDRGAYVRRPDLGRLLSPQSAQRLAALVTDADVAIVVGDGLSASAVAINAAPLVRALQTRLTRRGLSIAPIVLAAHARVALADPIGEILRARLSIMLIGERPGLSAADSLGVYVTYAPAAGTPDSRRNCISNIREGGLSIESAADLIDGLVAQIVLAGASGIGLLNAAGHDQRRAIQSVTPDGG